MSEAMQKSNESKPASKRMIIEYVADAIIPNLTDTHQRHLDISAGWGHLIRRLKARKPDLESWACDFKLMPDLGDIPGKEADLNKGDLPFEDNSFDLVTCTEAIEHIENFRVATREAFRVLKPGGLFFVSAPNILNLRSRWIFMTRGLYEFFDAVPTAESMGDNAWMRHISPNTFFHLAIAMHDQGFRDIRHHSGKVQKFSAALYWLHWPFAAFATARAKKRRDRKGRSICAIADQLAAEHHSWNIMTSRTMIVSARKPE